MLSPNGATEVPSKEAHAYSAYPAYPAYLSADDIRHSLTDRISWRSFFYASDLQNVFFMLFYKKRSGETVTEFEGNEVRRTKLSKEYFRWHRKKVPEN